MITRIVMNWDVTDSMDGHGLKKFVKGAVYDSRFEVDTPKAADGIQHSITHSLICKFIKSGAAHEQTWDEWASDKPAFKEYFDLIDSTMGKPLSANVTLHTLPNTAMRGFNPLREARNAVGEVEVHNID